MRLCIERNYRIIKPLVMSAIVLGGKAQEAIPNENFQPAFLHSPPQLGITRGREWQAKLLFCQFLVKTPFSIRGVDLRCLSIKDPLLKSLFFSALSI